MSVDSVSVAKAGDEGCKSGDPPSHSGALPPAEQTPGIVGSPASPPVSIADPAAVPPSGEIEGTPPCGTPASTAPSLPLAEPSPSSGPLPATPVSDANRKMRPADFFPPPTPLESGADPTVPVAFHPDEDFLASVDQILKVIRDDAAKIGNPDLFFSTPTGRFAALDCYGPGDAIGVANIRPEVPLLVIGDVHGDSWSLAAALRLASEPEWLQRLGVLSSTMKPAVVLLGDLVDRGPDQIECVLLALDRLRSSPSNSVWIAGNHDVGHNWNAASGRFVSDLSPAEFTDWLNAGEGQAREDRQAFGRAFVDFVQGLPRSVAFPSGLLAIHGGVPHCDIFPSFDSLDAIRGSSAAKDDFTWIRVAETAPTKYPNRTRRGCELGTQQLVASVAHVSQLLEKEGHAKVTAVARGHDHHGDRYFIHRAGFPPMSLVTLNTMGPSDDRDNPFITGDFHPCIGIYEQGRPPRIVKIVRPEANPKVSPGEAPANVKANADEVDAGSAASPGTEPDTDPSSAPTNVPEGNPVTSLGAVSTRSLSADPIPESSVNPIIEEGLRESAVPASATDSAAERSADGSNLSDKVRYPVVFCIKLMRFELVLIRRKYADPGG